MNRSRTILLVEDNPDDVDLAVRAFGKGRLGSDIIVARDGQEALDYLFAMGRFGARDLHVVPEVVLLDLKLPKLDGLEVLERMRADARTRRVPVVILTTSSEEADVARSYDLGANSFVRKPVSFEAFIAAARQLGTYWLDVNETAAPGATIRTT